MKSKSWYLTKKHEGANQKSRSCWWIFSIFTGLPTMNFYVKVVKRLRDWERVRPNLWEEGWVIHHENTSINLSTIAGEFLAQNVLMSDNLIDMIV